MRKLNGVLALIAIAFSSGCYSYSSFQSAKLLEPGRTSITPSASYNTRYSSGSGEDEIEIDDWVLDFQLRGGISPRFELGGKFSRIRTDEDGYQFIAIDPKFALEPERLAFSCPFGTFFGNGFESKLQIHPTLIARLPLEEGRTELNAAFKMLVFFTENTEEAFAFNVGPRFSSDLDRWAIHPEVGFLINPGDDGFFFQFGVGFMVSQ